MPSTATLQCYARYLLVGLMFGALHEPLETLLHRFSR